MLAGKSATQFLCLVKMYNPASSSCKELYLSRSSTPLDNWSKAISIPFQSWSSQSLLRLCRCGDRSCDQAAAELEALSLRCRIALVDDKFDNKNDNNDNDDNQDYVGLALSAQKYLTNTYWLCPSNTTSTFVRFWHS